MSRRLDVYLTESGTLPSREKAKELIARSGVSVNGKPCLKPAFLVEDSDRIEIRKPLMPYVSRGGLKLEKALTSFSLSLSGKVCADIGASSGGFTDCMLQNGASLVYAIDVGRDQLVKRLREDPRVINMEQTNFRYLTKERLKAAPDFASVDVSFISLSHILPVLFAVLKEDGRAVCLVKPQFEAGKGLVGKNGVVREPAIHQQVIRQVTNAAVSYGFAALGLDFSPIKGPEGNIEYLLCLGKMTDKSGAITAQTVEHIVEASHSYFQKPPR